MRFGLSPKAWERWVILRDRISKWHRWFAWYPVRLYNKDMCVWLEWVEQRAECANSIRAIWYWEYRLPPNGRETP